MMNTGAGKTCAVFFRGRSGATFFWNLPATAKRCWSGYDDFEKVKGVFISGGIDYLLKPVGREKLQRVIEKVTAILEKREEEKQRKQHQLIQEDKIASFLEDGEYTALLTASLYGAEAEAAEYSVSLEGNAAALVKFYDIAQIAVTLFHYNNKMSEFLIVGEAQEARLQRFAGKVLEQFPEEMYEPVSVALYQTEEAVEIQTSEIGAVYRELIAALVTRPFERRHSVVSCGIQSAEGKSELQQTGGETSGGRIVSSFKDASDFRGGASGL